MHVNTGNEDFSLKSSLNSENSVLSRVYREQMQKHFDVIVKCHCTTKIE